METFSFDPPINLVEEGKLLLAETSFEAFNSVFKLKDENSSSSVFSPKSLSFRGGAVYNKQTTKFFTA